MDFYSILKQYVGINRYIFYESTLIHYIRSNNIDKYAQNKLIKNTQYGGLQYSTKIDDIELKFEYYINESDDNKIIYISDLNDKSGLKYCAMLTYSNSETLNIGLIETPIRCISIGNIININKSDSSNIINNKLKYGDLMMKAIINFARHNNFKKIYLDDISRFNCIDSKRELSYSLVHVHILTNYYPWYYKYGFKFIFSKDHKKTKSNKKIIQEKLTKDLPFDKLMFMIYQNIYKTNPDINIHQEIFLILKLYIDLKEERLKIFLKKFTKQYCHIMAKIYMDIYHYFNLQSFDTNSMELIL